MKVFMNPYKKGSKGFKALLATLRGLGINAKGIRTVGSRYINKPDHLVINWGDSKCEQYPSMLNKPEYVGHATDKLATAHSLILNKVSTTPVMLNLGAAKAYMNDNGGVVYCRTVLNGSQGIGIVVAHSVDELVDAQLYTAGITGKRREYRVHVFNGKVIHSQQKKRRNGYKENPNYADNVRNLDSGWVFATDGVEVSDACKDASIKAVKALGLDFGGVDVIVDSDGVAYVIEVNTACGLQGTTVVKYANAIKEYIQENNHE
jgi:glutathione synthase/RimK-type ligase-like ATP-grasp enzyme